MRVTIESDAMLSIAPMMGLTDRHERFFLRLISHHVLLYTEMITVNALLHGDAEYLLQHDQREHPVVLQLGGADPHALSRCAHLVENCGYIGINLNVGCPSDRVQMGKFGACLMHEPRLVADCVEAIRSVVSLDVTVKTRIGIDEYDDYGFVRRFVEIVANGGCRTFVIHARKAWLKGLSPKQNREIPPLNYTVVYKLKEDFPELKFVLNGGIQSLEQACEHLDVLDGVMMGRAAYENPYLLARADQLLYDPQAVVKSRMDIFYDFLSYVEQQLLLGVGLSKMSRHLLGLFHGCRGAGAFRRYISEHAYRPGAGIEVLKQGLSFIEPDGL
ncbi:MAG: tRNA dihydrouridine(20/20a) synthase DusA [Proteobacteria bacterium]|nr:tRNA dihydrouridine(20/20a) synthase DusA [Pseudomonadota bacterium]